MKHAPCPWTTRFRDQDADELCVRDANGQIVCDLRYFATVSEARLLAAAPLMYEYVERRANAGDGEAQAVLQRVGGGEMTDTDRLLLHRRQLLAAARAVDEWIERSVFLSDEFATDPTAQRLVGDFQAAIECEE